jgi:hypothetical protein
MFKFQVYNVNNFGYIITLMLHNTFNDPIMLYCSIISILRFISIKLQTQNFPALIYMHNN